MAAGGSTQALLLQLGKKARHGPQQTRCPCSRQQPTYLYIGFCREKYVATLDVAVQHMTSMDVVQGQQHFTQPKLQLVLMQGCLLQAADIPLLEGMPSCGEHKHCHVPKPLS